MGLEAGEDQTVGPAGLRGGAKTACVRGWAPRDELGRNRYDDRMESGGLGDLFGDPEELQRRLAEFAEQMQGNQKLAWADNAIKLAVDMTVAAVERINLQGNAEAQAEQIRTVMARVFPEAVALVREAREGLQ
jgi:CHASE3 domain sensor protein